MRRGCFGLQQGLAAKAYAVYNKSKAVKCVQSPLEYQRTYAVGKEKCVSPSLLVSANGDGISPYPQPGFLFAWANTNANLEMYLRLNRLYNLTSPLKVALGISAIAGLPVDPASLEKNNGLLGHLGVYVLPEGERPSVPSLGFWFSLHELVRFDELFLHGYVHAQLPCLREASLRGALLLHLYAPSAIIAAPVALQVPRRCDHTEEQCWICLRRRLDRHDSLRLCAS